MSEEYRPVEREIGGKTRYDEYEELLVKRDQLLKEAGSYLTVYTAEFGELLNANFELKIECIKKKKTINYCSRRINRGESIDVSAMQAEIEQEMTLYYVELDNMVKDTESAKNAEAVGEYRFNRAKKLYRRLAKLLHPDINMKTMENERLRELWERTVRAYNTSNVDELEDLEVLVRKAMEELGDEGFEIVYTDIENRLERVEAQINDILNTTPYTYGEILMDEDKKAEYKKKLQAEHDEYKQYLEELSRTLEDMLREGGASFVWEMN